MYSDDGIRVNRSLENIHTSSSNQGVYHSSEDGRGGYRSQGTIHSLSQNLGVYHFGVDGIGGTRSEGNINSFFRNCVSIVDVDRIVVYRPHNSHYSPHNPGGRGRFLVFSFFLSYSID